MEAFWIPGRMPNLNDIIAASASHDRGPGGRGRKRWSQYNELKQAWSREILLYSRGRGLKAITTTCFTFMFVEKDKRRDPDNIIAGGMKLIFDGMKDARLIPNDGWNEVKEIRVYWMVDASNPGVLTILTKDPGPVDSWQKAHAIYSAFEEKN